MRHTIELLICSAVGCYCVTRCWAVMPLALAERRGTAAALAATNPVIADGQIVYETDTGLAKVGDGVEQPAIPHGSRQRRIVSHDQVWPVVIDILTDESYWSMAAHIAQTLCLCYLVWRHP